MIRSRVSKRIRPRHYAPQPRPCGTAPRWRTSVVLLVFVSLIMLVAPAYAYQVHNYWTDPVLAGHTIETNVSASREYNKVWRPSGISFGLSYSTSSWVFNSVANPFVDNRSAFNARARCSNNSGSYASPVTCQTTIP